MKRKRRRVDAVSMKVSRRIDQVNARRFWIFPTKQCQKIKSWDPMACW